MHKAPEWDRASAAVRAADSILIVTHISPDGDAIGSALGLANALRQQGKAVTVANDDGVPDYLQFLPGADTVVETLNGASWDVMISTDASDDTRCGAVGLFGMQHSQTVINLDHHVTNTYFGDIHLVLPSAVSAAEIVFDWWQRLGIDWNRDIAMPLLTGMVTDTIGFRVSSVTTRTLEIARELMDKGASLTEVTARTLDSKSYAELSLWKQVLPSAELDGEVIHVVVRQADIEAAGLDDPSVASLVGLLVQINEAMIAVVFKETPDNEVKISMRSKRGYNVAEVAFALGGGGHAQAAGATVSGTLDEVQARVLPMLHDAAAKGTLDIV